MYKYSWDLETGGFLLNTEIAKFSKEPRPVYAAELDLLGFEKFWNYPHDIKFPIMWAESNNYIYKGRTVAKTKGGTLYSAPEIVLLDNPEIGGKMLDVVDIARMVEKNSDILENLAQESIQNIYNTYTKYKDKVDLFYVAFSGGKDSIVTLDLVQKALPHDEFITLFSDTYMEFPDTYECVNKIHEWCNNNSIEFLTSKAERTPVETWKIFGPPATVTRWCCSVHKTAPQILLLRSLLNKPDFTGMAFVGVRGDESISRSKYEYITYAGKHKGQYSCNAVLDWNSAEIYLYIYKYNLILNEAYKKGNRRAGCLVCPRAAERNEYTCQKCYPEPVEQLLDLIRENYSGKFAETHSVEQFIMNGGWKARKNGRDINIHLNYCEQSNKESDIIIEVDNPRTNWKTWIKTIGILSNDNSPYVIDFHGQLMQFNVEEYENKLIVRIDKEIAHTCPLFVKLMKNVFRKSACCVGCRVCQADCPYGYLNFKNGIIEISDECHHCSQCHKVEKGCLVYKSLEMPKGGIIMNGKTMSLNSYSHHAPKMEWIEQYFRFKNTFDENNTLGSQMYGFFKRFLRDANLLDNNGYSKTAEIIEKIGLDNLSSWGIIFVNLCYTPQIGWFVQNTNFDEEYLKEFLASLMIDAGAKDSWTGDIFSSLVRMCELPLGKVGLGSVYKENNRARSITRHIWENPDPRVVLFSLYKFAEANEHCYQFTLETLLDKNNENSGFSPTKIFGLDRETMVGILNGLTVNYPEFISATFSLNLDSITLRPNGVDLNSDDVLNIF